MAVTSDAIKALHKYREHADRLGRAENVTIYGAVLLTPAQQAAIAKALTAFWRRQYLCPRTLDVKPRHGYESRVVKDGFTSEQFVEWVVTGCSDIAAVETDGRGRPRLVIKGIKDDARNVEFDLVVPIGSDSNGYIHVFDVIPRGLEPKQKKTAPSANP